LSGVLFTWVGSRFSPAGLHPLDFSLNPADFGGYRAQSCGGLPNLFGASARPSRGCVHTREELACVLALPCGAGFFSGGAQSSLF